MPMYGVVEWTTPEVKGMSEKRGTNNNITEK